MKIKLFASSAVALGLISSAAVAQPPVGVKQTPNQLTGSDTLDSLINFAISELQSSGKIAVGDISYNPQGSGAGQNQLEGGTTTSG